MNTFSALRHSLAAACLGAALLSGPAAAAPAPYSDQQLRTLYEEAAAVGALSYTFLMFATRDEDIIQDAHRRLLSAGPGTSLKNLPGARSNSLMVFVLPAPLREQLNQLIEGGRSAPFQLPDGGWAIVELESVDTSKSMPTFEQLKARLPGFVAVGALPTPDDLRNDPVLVQRTLLNKVDSAKSFDKLPPGMDVDQPLSSGYLLLQQALIRDDAALVAGLLKRRTKANLCPMRACPLQLALQSPTHATEYVKQLLDAGVQPDQVPAPDADTALTIAALAGNADVVKLLLDKGADINGGKGPRVPLTVAIHRGYGDVVQLLLDKGADPLFRKPVKTPGMSGSSISAMSIALQNGKPEGALLRTAVMKKFSSQPQHQWDGWLEQDGERLPMTDGTLHLKRKPFTLFLRMPADSQMRLASCTSTRIFDEIRTNDLGAAVYQLDKPGLEPRDGSARWLLVSSDINPAAKGKRPPATQTWQWSGLRQDFNRRDKTPQGDVFVREIDAFMMAAGSGEYARVAIEESKLPEVNIVIGSALDYDSSAGDFVNAHHIKLVFDR
ncbi:MAG: ankyrin repeat and protein 2 [Moraxellaceae bacterium]|jgi:hypothetical protein|nr:ankyrin repeat and protein 2 [Moraxellaceae bacterium]